MNQAKKLAKLEDKQVLNHYLSLFNEKFHVVALVLVTLALYLPSLNGTFLSDDLAGIVTNKDLFDLGLQLKSLNIQKIIWSLLLLAFGLKPFYFHFVSVAFHILAVVAFYKLAKQITHANLAVLAALLFASHPVNVESVAWISGFNYVFGGFAFFVIANCYLKAGESGNKRLEVVSLLLYLVALVLIRNAWLISFSLMLFVLQFIKKGVWLEKRQLFYLVGSVALLFVLVYENSFRVSLLSSVGGYSEGQGTYVTRVFNTSSKALELLVFPKNLTLYHEGEDVSITRAFFMLGSLVLILGALVWGLIKKSKVALVFMLIPLALAPLFSPVQVTWVIAERYLYLPSAFYSLGLVLLLSKMSEKVKNKNLPVVIMAVLLLLFGLKVYARNGDWADFRNFAIANSRVSPNSPQALNALGDYYFEVNDLSGSKNALERAVGLYPGYTVAVHNLGRTYYSLGMVSEAEKQFEVALSQNPAMTQSLNALGIIEYERGNKAEALLYAEKSLEISKDNPTALKLKGLIEGNK